MIGETLCPSLPISLPDHGKAAVQDGPQRLREPVRPRWVSTLASSVAVEQRRSVTSAQE
jgi:hypothetical protein